MLIIYSYCRLNDIDRRYGGCVEEYGCAICAHRKIASRKILISLPNLTDTRTHNFRQVETGTQVFESESESWLMRIIENPCVGGSIPPRATKIINSPLVGLFSCVACKCYPIFRKITPSKIKAAPIQRIGILGSPKTKTPRVKVPTAPMDVQTAYAVPIGIPFNEYQSRSPLNAMLVPAKAKPQIFIPGLLDSFNPRGQPISKTPAINRDSQYMLSPGLKEELTISNFFKA